MANFYHFEQTIKQWTSPDHGSPDILFDKIIPRIGPKRPGLDISQHRPRSGKVAVAIKTFGCNNQTTHCKEYLQVKLKKPLERDRAYYAEFWVNPAAAAVKTNNIGLSLSEVEIQDDSEYGIYYFEPVIMSTSVIDQPPNQWVRISGTFTVEWPYEYILIGNFFTDDETEHIQKKDGLAYSFYLIDDVLLRPLDEPKNQALEEQMLEVGNTIVLRNIHFEHDRAELLPRSYEQLNQLAEIMQSAPSLRIRIAGHTDLSGKNAYNLQLSKKRAANVRQYLLDQGIEAARLEAVGFGEQLPISTENHAENRRVELLILAK